MMAKRISPRIATESVLTMPSLVMKWYRPSHCNHVPEKIFQVAMDMMYDLSINYEFLNTTYVGESNRRSR